MMRQTETADGNAGGAFDPPRAKRGARFRGWYYAAQRRFPKAAPFVLGLGRMPTVAAFVIPGVALALLGMLRLAAAVAVVCVVALVVAIAGIGAPWAMLPVGALISAHSFGVSIFVTYRWPEWSLPKRMLVNIGIAAAGFSLLPSVIGWVLSPIVVLAGDREAVYLMNPRRALEAPHPGERLLVEHEGFGNLNGLRMKAGAYLVDAVLVGPGEYRIDGDLTTWSTAPVLATPASGAVESLRLGQNSVLIWPVNMRRLASRAVPVEAESFVLDRRRIVGRPYKRWFWRTFEHEPLP
jgi:hypothetical protein